MMLKMFRQPNHLVGLAGTRSSVETIGVMLVVHMENTFGPRATLRDVTYDV